MPPRPGLKRLAVVALMVCLSAVIWAGIRWQQNRWSEALAFPTDAGSLPPTLVQVLQAAHKEAIQWPRHKGTLEHLVVLYLSNGLDEPAEPLLEILVREHPQQPEWVHRLAVVKGKQGDLERAVSLWERIKWSAQAPTPVRIKWADALVKLNRLPAAESLYEEIRAATPDEPYATYGLARLALQREDWAKAKTLLTRSLEKEPNFYGNHALLQAVARHEGDDLLAQKEDIEIKRMGRFREIPDPWCDGKREDTFDPKFARIAGDLHFSQQEWAEAGSWYQRTLELDPKNIEALLWLGASWEQRGDKPQAILSYRTAITRDPNHTKSYYWLSRLLRKDGDEKGALEVLEQGLAAVPDEVGFLLPVARDRLNRGAWSEAIPLLERAVALDSNDAALAVELALCHFRTGALDTGARVLENSHRLHPDHVRTLALLAMQATLGGNEAQASAWLQRLKGVPQGLEASVPIAHTFEARFGHLP